MAQNSRQDLRKLINMHLFTDKTRVFASVGHSLVTSGCCGHATF